MPELHDDYCCNNRKETNLFKKKMQIWSWNEKEKKNPHLGPWKCTSLSNMSLDQEIKLSPSFSKLNINNNTIIFFLKTNNINSHT